MRGMRNLYQSVIMMSKVSFTNPDTTPSVRWTFETLGVVSECKTIYF